MMLKPDPTHPCLGIFEAGRKSHRSRVYSDGRQHYCERCGEKLTHENFSNVPKNYVTTHDAGDYNLPAWKSVQTRDPRTDLTALQAERDVALARAEAAEGVLGG